MDLSWWQQCPYPSLWEFYAGNLNDVDILHNILRVPINKENKTYYNADPNSNYSNNPCVFYIPQWYIMLCINFITDQNSEEHIRSCLQQEKLSTKVYNAVMLYIIMYNNNTCIMKIKVKSGTMKNFEIMI